MDIDAQSTPLYQNLDTAFVNLWSLLRNLTERGFIGRVHVELKDYAADIFLNGSPTPAVVETDRIAGITEQPGELHRVVLRAREAAGTITVFETRAEGSTDRVAADASPGAGSAAPDILDVAPPLHDLTRPRPDDSVTSSIISGNQNSSEFAEDIYPTGSYHDWPAILSTTGALIGAIERGVNASGQNFRSLFDSARLELADDYSFLDPMARAFAYEQGSASLHRELSVAVFVAGLTEALRRSVDNAATGERGRRIRERVALEMLTVARQHSGVLEKSGFRAQLDRIAGTRVM